MQIEIGAGDRGDSRASDVLPGGSSAAIGLPCTMPTSYCITDYCLFKERSITPFNTMLRGEVVEVWDEWKIMGNKEWVHEERSGAVLLVNWKRTIYCSSTLTSRGLAGW
jgi:hypothetical protein